MSVRELAAALPDIETVRSRSVTLAALDAILSDDWESRWYSFDPTWGEQEQLASMRNGSGDEYSIVFFAEGAFIRGFDHESDMNPVRAEPPALWPGLTAGIPDPFMEFVNEAAFSGADDVPLITVCLWRRQGDEFWQFGDVAYPPNGGDADGSGWLFEQLLNNSPRSYVDFAAEYFEVQLEESDVAAIYGGVPLTRERVGRMNPERHWGDLIADLENIGYPVQGS